MSLNSNYQECLETQLYEILMKNYQTHKQLLWVCDFDKTQYRKLNERAAITDHLPR